MRSMSGMSIFHGEKVFGFDVFLKNGWDAWKERIQNSVEVFISTLSI